MYWVIILVVIILFFLGVAVFDLMQTKSAISRNFPVIGHGRHVLESLGPKLRQYIVAANDEERPFSRDQRHWVYSSAAKTNNYFGFGSDNDLECSPNYLIIKHSPFPLPDPPNNDPLYSLPCAKIMGQHRNRKHQFRPSSAINISAMSYGSLSARAVESLNRGAKICGCLQNTGEGGLSEHHQHGGELIWQIGTGYFGCRNDRGQFDLARFLDVVAANPIRAIEIKLSQGAKPGRGGLLPAAKITPEIAAIRGIPMGVDCASPSSHSSFSDVDSMLDFVELLAEKTGLPIGIKSAVGEMNFWQQLATMMSTESRGVDFISIDGGEGGTGAAPLVFADHVALPFKIAFTRVYRVFHEHNIADKMIFIGSGKLGFPETALFAFAVGCDAINIAREAMLAIGCIQAQQCHAGNCPTGVATQRKWLMRGLEPTSNSARLANYIVTLRKELLHLSRTCGVEHPSLVTTEHFEILTDGFQSNSLIDSFHLPVGSGLPAKEDQEFVRQLYQSNNRE